MNTSSTLHQLLLAYLSEIESQLDMFPTGVGMNR